MTDRKTKKGEGVSGVVALIHFIISFFTDHLVFEALPGNGVIADFLALPEESRVHFIACKLLLLVLLLAIWRTVFRLFADLRSSLRQRVLCHAGAGEAYRIAGYSLIYFVPIIFVLIFKLPEGFLSNDETLIFAEASALHTYTWFYYLTTYYYIVTMMLIPSWLGPVLVKVALQLITCGYCVYRFRRLTLRGVDSRSEGSAGENKAGLVAGRNGGKNLGAVLRGRVAYLIYVPFFLFPVLAYTTSAHRIPVYYLIYLIVVVKLVTDRLEEESTPASTCPGDAGRGSSSGISAGSSGGGGKSSIERLTPVSFIMLLFAFALLTQWRTEGIYMAPLSVLLLILAYPDLISGGEKILRCAQDDKSPRNNKAGVNLSEAKNPPGEEGKAGVNLSEAKNPPDRESTGNLGMIAAIRYRISRVSKKKLVLLLLSCALMQYAVQIPQNGALPSRMDDKAANRMGPFWAYTITNMYRNGLDLERNAEDLEKVYRYLDRDVLEAINRDLGDINYEDTLILYYPGYTGVIEGGDYEAYVEGCRNIFKNNPAVFLKTRWGAFKYAALPYRIGTDTDGIKGLIKLAFSVFKSLSYNLFIPCTLLLVLLLYSLIRKRWLYFFIYAGLCCHWFIVFLLAPASYFKYYLPVYMTVYFALTAKAVLHMAGRLTGDGFLSEKEQ